jgi:hypothetical protein
MNIRIGVGPLSIRVPLWLVMLLLTGGGAVGYAAGRAWLFKELGF